MPYCKERLECRHFDPAGCDAEVGTGCFEEIDSHQTARPSGSTEAPGYTGLRAADTRGLDLAKWCICMAACHGGREYNRVKAEVRMRYPELKDFRPGGGPV